MYEEGNRKISFNWGSLLIKLVLLAGIVFLACWIYVRVVNNSNSDSSAIASTSDYITNISAMKEAAFEYYTSSKLPEKVGDTSKLTLEEMLNQKLLIDFTDDGDTCSLDESYIQATKTADGNYALKVSLTCGDKSDFIVTTIESNGDSNSTTVSDATSSDVVVDDSSDTTNTTADSSTSNNSSSSSSSTTNSSSSSSGTTSTASSSKSSTTTTVTTTVTTSVNIKISGSCSTSCCTSSCNTTTTTPSTDSCKTNNTCTDTTKSTTRYYKLVKYSDWVEGYSSAENVENKEVSSTTAKYCKIKTNTYYTTSYINYKSSATSYSYIYTLSNLTTSNADNVSINTYNYFTSSDYATFLNQSNTFYSTSGTTTNVSISLTNFKASSLKSSNFTFSVNSLSTSNGYYTAKVNVNYLNGNCVTAYNIGTSCVNCVYFVPVKFTVTYTDLNDCVTDNVNNAYKYTSYTAYDKQTTTTWYHRTVTYTWSTSKTLEGYTYTGIYEDR